MFVYRAENTNENGLIGFIFMKPFEPSVWFSMILTILVVSIFYKLNYIYENLKVSHTLKINSSPSYISTIITAYGAFCQQGKWKL